MKDGAFFCYFSEEKVKNGTEARKGHERYLITSLSTYFQKTGDYRSIFLKYISVSSFKTATHDKARGAAITTVLFSSSCIFLHKCFLGDFTL